MKRFQWIALALAAVMLALPSSGLAQSAAGDQYQEVVPQAGGNNSGSGGGGGGGGGSTSSGGSVAGGSSSSPSGGTAAPSSGSSPSSGAGSGGTAGGTIDPKTITKLKKKGDGGSGAGGFAQGSAPDSEALREAAREAQSGSPDSSNGVFGSAAEDNSGGGMGIWVLLIVLAATALVGAGYWAWRRRQPSDPGAAGLPRKKLRGLKLNLRGRAPGGDRDDRVGRA